MIEIIEDSREVKTRKNHQCMHCLDVFPKGFQMFAQVCKCDGEIYRVMSCTTCEALVTEFCHGFYSHYIGGYEQGVVAETCDEFKCNNEELLAMLRSGELIADRRGSIKRKEVKP